MTKYNNKFLVKWHSYTLPIQQLYTNIYKYYINSFVNIKIKTTNLKKINLVRN